MSLSTTYDPASVEEKWYNYWMEHNFFDATPDSSKEPYCIVIPPPNVTGVLHMGHMLNSSIQDVLIRKARMEGKVACWVPGTDHASIATEARVVAMLKEKGIKKSDLSRDDFLHYAWEWKEKYGGEILKQLKKIGASCDWRRTTFTMDSDYYKAVTRVFVDLFNKGYIYRDFKMINWDPEAKTALSGEEVIYAEEGEQSILYTVRYQLQGSDRWINIATQRPETIMGDVAIAINPSDVRYKEFIGKTALVPFVDREIPIIADSYVDTSFGTGCLKVTPAHDINDYEMGLRHSLPIIDTIDENGALNARCGIPKFVGKDRFLVRKEIVEDLRQSGHLIKESEFTTRIGRSERTQSIIEPRLSLQWFVKMKDLSQRAYWAVEKDEIKLHPSKFKNMYKHWMGNIRDWCISRQLWWGHRIPAYFYGPEKNDFVVAHTIQEAALLASDKLKRKITEKDLRQDADTLDTWMSSWLWPIAVFDGFKDASFVREKGTISSAKGSDLSYFYPTQVLVTAPEIIFFWVARMIIAGYEYMDKKPFENVYLTGIVKDKKRRKMSKSLGNSPDPLDLIALYGADGVRAGMLFCSAAGNDLLFDEKLCKQGRNFTNKLWNAFRLIKSWDVVASTPVEENTIAAQWFASRLNQAVEELQELFKKFRISEALITTYKLVWDDFCAWYLEIIKPAFGSPIDKMTYDSTVNFFETILKLLHPFMPFITEELWHKLADNRGKDCIIVAAWPIASPFDEKIIMQGRLAFEIITQIRNVRNTKNIPSKAPLDLIIKGQDKRVIGGFFSIIRKVATLGNIRFTDQEHPSGASFIVKTIECIVPLKETLDVGKARESVAAELSYAKGFLKSILQKLQNEKFMKNAPPHVIDMEQKKKADTESTIITLENNLKALGGQ